MNIGRWRRALSARSTSAQADDRQRAGGAARRRCRTRAGARAGRPARIASPPKRAASVSPRSSVRLATVIACGLLRREVRGASSIISPAPTNSTLWSCEVVERCAAPAAPRPRPSIRSARRSRWCVRTSLATAKERWNSWCSVVPSVPAASARAHRVLHLAEDLRLAQHHRVEPAGDAERVAHRLLVAAACRGSGAELAGADAVVLAPATARSASPARSPADSRARCGCRSRGSPPRAPSPRFSSPSASCRRSTWNTTRSRTASGAVW